MKEVSAHFFPFRPFSLISKVLVFMQERKKALNATETNFHFDDAKNFQYKHPKNVFV